jgi:hypothetical protein
MLVYSNIKMDCKLQENFRVWRTLEPLETADLTKEEGALVREGGVLESSREIREGPHRSREADPLG